MKVKIYDLEISTDDMGIIITDNTRSYKVSDMTIALDAKSYNHGESVALDFGDNVTVYLSKPEAKELIELAAQAIGAIEVVPTNEEKHP
jgi:hypothetical protein